MNWIAYNAAQDVSLHGASGGPLPFLVLRPLPFLVLPQAEAAGVRFDSTDVQRFSYTVNASRVEG